jgi:hypothetical protein
MTKLTTDALYAVEAEALAFLRYFEAEPAAQAVNMADGRTITPETAARTFRSVQEEIRFRNAQAWEVNA